MERSPVKLNPLRSIIHIAVFSLLLFLPCVTVAQLSPGKLTTFHAELEGLSNCTQCHELGQAVSSEKCLACHTAIRSRISEQYGYHASEEVQDSECTQCHSEHHGRDFDIVHWRNGQEHFDHSLTGYRLEGRHGEPDCRECHQMAYIQENLVAGDENVNRQRTYLGLSSQCTSCHVDEHADQLTDTCLDCHDYNGWKPAPGFNHAETDFALTGSHTSTACNECHPAQPQQPATGLIAAPGEDGTRSQFSDIRHNSCSACHDDVHNGRFGADCERCHSTSSFREVSIAGGFDHTRTDFPLEGRHVEVECADCHTSGKMTDPLAYENCSDCHEDAHFGQFADRADGGRCESCHTVEGFAPPQYTFADHQQSDYPLTGSHMAVPCNLCHQVIMADDGTEYRDFEMTYADCGDCHDDVHQGQLDIWVNREGCDFCHSTDTWHRTSFDHSLARFALEGRHREILCLECHTITTATGEELVWMKPITMECAGCHDDIHAGQFLREGDEQVQCERCHRPSGWKNLQFVHNRDARFILDGSHVQVACGECHREEWIDGEWRVRYRPMGQECVDCHGDQR